MLRGIRFATMIFCASDQMRAHVPLKLMGLGRVLVTSVATIIGNLEVVRLCMDRGEPGGQADLPGHELDQVGEWFVMSTPDNVSVFSPSSSSGLVS